MLSIKNLKPYKVSKDEKYIYVTLAYRHFDILMQGETFQFIPIEATTIQLSRYTRQVINQSARFAFQRENKIIYIKMSSLIILPMFMESINKIADNYLKRKASQNNQNSNSKLDLIFYELERENIKRLIDQALDRKCEYEFNMLVKQLRDQTIQNSTND